MTKPAAALLCILLVSASAAFAQTPPVRAWLESPESQAFSECWFRGRELPDAEQKSAFAKCMKEMTPTIAGLRQTLVNAERSMANAYAQAESKFGPLEGRKTSNLLLAQRQWAKYREAHCSFEVERARGKYESGYLFAECALAEAIKREAYLKSLLQ